MKPICIDLFCGLGGWAEGFLSEGYDVVGFDIERHRYPSRAIDSDSIKAGGIDFARHDSFNGTTEKRLRDAPLTGGWDEYPAQLVLQDVLTLHGSQFRNAACIVASPPCQAYSYRAMPWKRAKALPPPSNELFDACFRIQREACEAAGRYIPMVIENVKGAQPWVGRAAWHFGSFYLWGDVPALMPIPSALRKSMHTPLCETPKGTGSTSWFFGNSKHEGRFYGMKGNGGGWFGDYQEMKAKQDQAIAVANREPDPASVLKQGGEWWHDSGSITRRFSSRSHARKAASAQIAKIPFPLSSHIARVFKP